jgi:hypothetical protein
VANPITTVRAPWTAATQIAGETRISADRIVMVLRDLESHDLIGLDGASERIRMAYPFTEAGTEHRIELNGRALHALSAIDALGVGAMYGTDTKVSSQCRHCGETIHTTTTDEGRSIETVRPSSAVVWYDFAYDGCAASSSCPSIAFFCSPDHLSQWRALQTSGRNGAQLTMHEALELGRAIFGPVLVEQGMTRRQC